MNKTNIEQQLRRSFLALTIVGALFTLPNAEACLPVPATGYTIDCEHLISHQSFGPTTIITVSITVCSHGTFEGTWVGTETAVIVDGHLTGYASGVFSGTVNGRSGTCIFNVQVNVSGQQSHWVVDQGTGDLAGLSGEGTFHSGIENGPGCPTSGFDCENCPPATGTCDDSFTLNYNGQIQFAP
jgi:hypothetical protein